MINLSTVRDTKCLLFRTFYSILVAFTVEDSQTRHGTKPEDQNTEDYVVRRPIRGMLTNHGYCIPDPTVPNRLSVWFSGGSLKVQDKTNDLEVWKRLFDTNEAPRRGLSEYARVLAARILLGARIADEMAEDGTLSYSLKRPIGGHGSVFIDVLYSDNTMRIVRGHHGSIFVFIRSL